MVEFFKKFGYGSGSGYGSGYGYGDGSGDGSGKGDGYGDGSGKGDGYGHGSGKGYGDGYGYGYGDGSGKGDGSGYGSGYGYGDGSGDGSGKGDGYQLKNYEIVDGIWCKVLNAKNNYYKVETFPKRRQAYIAIYNNELAHGETLREAQEGAKRKYFSGLTFEENKKLFLQEFEKKRKLSGKALYEWHGVLTGSCRFGRDRFCEHHNINLRKKYTLKEFVDIVKDDFGGNKIKQLLER